MGTVYTEGVHTAEWLISEGNGKISRETGTFAAALNTKYPSGTVLGRITATGKLVPSLNAASDGSQVAVAVLYNEVPAGAARDVKVTYIARNAEVFGAMLNNAAALESGVVTELAAVGIIAR
jgi:hypothetical protein